MDRIDLTGTVPTEIAANVGRFLTAVATGDGSGAARAYLEDALLAPPAGDVIRGRDAIERFWRGGMEIGLHSMELEPRWHGRYGAVLYEHGDYRMLLVPARDRSTMECGAYVMVHVQAEDGSWHFAVTTFRTCDATHGAGRE
jgi:ketosteroid isomerase-like protein